MSVSIPLCIDRNSSASNQPINQTSNRGIVWIIECLTYEGTEMSFVWLHPSEVIYKIWLLDRSAQWSSIEQLFNNNDVGLNEQVESLSIVNLVHLVHYGEAWYDLSWVRQLIKQNKQPINREYRCDITRLGVMSMLCSRVWKSHNLYDSHPAMVKWQRTIRSQWLTHLYEVWHTYMSNTSTYYTDPYPRCDRFLEGE